MKISDLTLGERYQIARRRLGESQSAAAERLEVTLYRYRKIEADAIKAKPVKLGKLQPYEICFIKRTRAKLEVRELAAALDCTPWWLTQMEYGRQPCTALVEHWNAA